MSTAVVNGTTPETFLLPPNCINEQWCRDWYGYINYIPSLAGNAFFLTAITIGLFAQTYLGVRYRAWTFTGPMIVGILLEIVGYGGRIGMHGDIFINSWFIMYLCCLTIAPALFSAAVYLSLSRIIAMFGHGLALLRPRTITIGFITCDFLSLLLQAIGGALASTASSSSGRDIGVDIMVAGLSTQVAATTAFAVLCIHLMFAIRRHSERLNNDVDVSVFRRTKSFRGFLLAIAIAVTTILIRCSFRVAELSEGFKGKLANDETLFMVFDSAMMVICVLVLSLAHPGVALKGRWALGEVRFRKNGRASRERIEDGAGHNSGTPSETEMVSKQHHVGSGKTAGF